MNTARSNLYYAPAQVFCEYIPRVFDDGHIHGLAWTSAEAVVGRCLALDVPHQDCVDNADRPQLALAADSNIVHQCRAHEFRPL